MGENLPNLRRGRIIFASIRDRNGYPKNRPCLILTRTEDITDEDPLVVVAITSTFGKPPPKDCIELPWHSRGHPVTGLNRRSAAVIGWYDEVVIPDVLGYAGDVPPAIMLEILARLEAEDESDDDAPR